MELPFSQACENNKQPILAELKTLFANRELVFEIGTGTAQHAVYFAQHLPHLIWQTSDIQGNHFGINLRLEVQQRENVRKPLMFKIGEHYWPKTGADAVFTANTTHIMQRYEAKLMMQLVANNLPEGGIFCQYGPFNMDGHYTSESNKRFDEMLLSQGYGGICDIADLQAWVKDSTIQLTDNIAMPANNRLLVWRT